MSREQELRGCVVLAVDDAPETLSMLSAVLSEAGATVLIALEAEQAQTIALKMQPDLILLDALMPGTNGFDLCRRFKQIQALQSVPVIFMTGLSDTESVVRGLEVGGVDYVTKPIDGDELVARIKVHLANARLAQSARSALDAAGQNLFSSDDAGQIRWATPQVFALFEQVKADFSWMQQALAAELVSWLARKPAQGNRLSVEAPGSALSIRYLGESAPGEHLFRAHDPRFASDSDWLSQQFSLTEREGEVLLWLVQGKTNREIGVILDMSPRTVNKHLEQVFRKLGVENRTAAAAQALRLLGEHGRLD